MHFWSKKFFLNLSPWFVPWWIISNDSLQIGKLLNTNKENGKSKRSGIILYRISKLCSCEVDLYRRWSYASCWSAKCEAFRFLSIHTLAIWKSEGRKELPLQIHAFKVHLTWKWKNMISNSKVTEQLHLETKPNRLAIAMREENKHRFNEKVI